MPLPTSELQRLGVTLLEFSAKKQKAEALEEFCRQCEKSIPAIEQHLNVRTMILLNGQLPSKFVVLFYIHRRSQETQVQERPLQGANV